MFGFEVKMSQSTQNTSLPTLKLKKKINGLTQAYNFSSYKINKPSRANSFNFKS
ncbi:hypothetical protein Hanom_Chr03g00249781 [Helianthus anomalus]